MSSGKKDSGRTKITFGKFFNTEMNRRGDCYFRLLSFYRHQVGKVKRTRRVGGSLRGILKI